jgi:hypothetical protein
MPEIMKIPVELILPGMRVSYITEPSRNEGKYSVISFEFVKELYREPACFGGHDIIAIITDVVEENYQLGKLVSTNRYKGDIKKELLEFISYFIKSNDFFIKLTPQIDHKTAP